MKIIIDASWIGSQFGKTNINGGYRVLDSFIRQLYRYPHHKFILTHTSHKHQNSASLFKYLQRIGSPPNIKISARAYTIFDKPWGTKMYRLLNKNIPVSLLIPFINPKEIASADVYHSAFDAIPYQIRKKDHLIHSFVALDLIPMMRPDISSLFYDYTKNLYDKLTSKTQVFAISHSTKNDILSYRPDLAPSQIKVTHLAADPSIFYPIESTESTSTILHQYGLSNKKYFLTVNNLAPYKNSKFTITSFLEWLEHHNVADLYLVVIGRSMDTNYAQELKKTNLKTEKIIFLENIEDDHLAALYSQAMVFLYLSLYEGFGLPILEALQCGTPVICSNTSSMPEVAGNACKLVDPLDQHQIIEAMNELYENADLRVQYKQLGLTQASTFSWSRYADQIIQRFEVIARSGILTQTPQ